MSKILSTEEAEKIAKSMSESVGFIPMVLQHDPRLRMSFLLGYSRISKKEKGFLWWKKIVEVVTFEPVFASYSWEEVLNELDMWINTHAKKRIDLAEKFREEYDQKEASKVLDKEMSK